MGASFPADKPICHDLARRSDDSCNLSVVRVRASLADGMSFLPSSLQKEEIQVRSH
jgi:hypothetical protein